MSHPRLSHIISKSSQRHKPFKAQKYQKQSKKYKCNYSDKDKL